MCGIQKLINGSSFHIPLNSKSWYIALTPEERVFYFNLYRLIVLEPNVEQLIAFVSQEEDKSRVTQWINKNIVIISDTSKTHQRGLLSSPGLPEPAGEGVFYAHSLCQLAVKYNYRDLVQFLIVHCGADLSSSCLQIIAQDKSDADIEPTDAMFTMVLNTFHEPVEFLKVVLNSGVTQKYEDSSQSRKTFTFDFAVLCPPLWSPGNNESDTKQMNVLNAIVNSSDDLHCAQYELLKHPLIETFLNLKWKHYRKFFHLLVFIYTVFVLSFSTVAYWMSKGFQHAKSSGNGTAGFTETDLKLLDAGNAMVCFSGAFLFVHAIIQITYLPLRKLIWDLELLLNLVAASGAIFISIYLLTISHEDYFEQDCEMPHHLASWIVLIVWTNLMLLVGRLPKFGCYSLMLTTVTKNFLKVMTSFIFLVIGFALSFTLIFPTSEFFKSPWDSFVRTIVMMIGEFEYTSTYSESTDLIVVGTSRFLFLIFIITCSIILMNLTQGIAVNDIKLLQDISQEIRVQKETRFLYELERVFTHPIVLKNRLMRNIKLFLFDSGTIVHGVTVSRNDRKGLSAAFYDKLIRDF